MNKWTYAATVAASLAWLLVAQQDGVGLTLFDSVLRQQLPVSSSPANLHRLIELVARTTPAGPTDAKRLLPQMAERLGHRSMVVLVSDLLADVADVAAGLHRLRFGGHDVLVIHVLDQDELEFPFAERTLFTDMEDPGREVRTDPQALRGAYLERVREFISSLRGACLNQRIDYALFSTADPLDVVLTSFLSTRMRRQRARA